MLKNVCPMSTLDEVQGTCWFWVVKGLFMFNKLFALMDSALPPVPGIVGESWFLFKPVLKAFNLFLYRFNVTFCLGSFFSNCLVQLVAWTCVSLKRVCVWVISSSRCAMFYYNQFQKTVWENYRGKIISFPLSCNSLIFSGIFPGERRRSRI